MLTWSHSGCGAITQSVTEMVPHLTRNSCMPESEINTVGHRGFCAVGLKIRTQHVLINFFSVLGDLSMCQVLC